ncbi:hypothetical protein GCM10010368_40810 [Streptomyces roseiscleroticus]|uniref:Transposase n=1 Tax=Streptomyces roseiscleroticus TaxID=1972 RepID=A0ABN3ERB3_9ACTN
MEEEIGGRNKTPGPPNPPTDAEISVILCGTPMSAQKTRTPERAERRWIMARIKFDTADPD